MARTRAVRPSGVDNGTALILTTFSPDDGTEALAEFDSMLSSMRWPGA